MLHFLLEFVPCYNLLWMWVSSVRITKLQELLEKGQEEDFVKAVYEGDRVYHKIIIHEEYQAVE